MKRTVKFLTIVFVLSLVSFNISLAFEEPMSPNTDDPNSKSNPTDPNDLRGHKSVFKNGESCCEKDHGPDDYCHLSYGMTLC